MKLKEEFEKQDDPPRIPKTYLVQWSKLVHGREGHTLEKMRSTKIGRPRGITTKDSVKNLNAR